MNGAGGRENPLFPAENDRLRERTGLLAVAALTVLGSVLCIYVAYPFLPALAWALALAVMAFPMHGWIARRIPSRNWAAGISTTIVVVIVLIPIMGVGAKLAADGPSMTDRAQEMARNGQLDGVTQQVPGGSAISRWLRENHDLQAEAEQLASRFIGDAAAIAEGSAWISIQLLICIFVLFFAFRDWRHLLDSLRGLSPFSNEELDYLFLRVADSIHATVYATILTSLLQGVTGGLLFWALGLPSPILWAVVMTILGVLPIVGPFLVWVPAGIYLAAEGRWGAAIILFIWGILMVGPILNYVYAHLAGGRMRIHPVPALISFVGGLVVFGIAGMVLGPVILVVTVGLIDVWRRRMNPESDAAAEIESAAATTDLQSEKDQGLRERPSPLPGTA